MGQESGTGFHFAPFLSDDIGRRFERDVVPTSRMEGTSAAGLETFLTGPVTNLVSGGVYEYDKAFDPSKINQLVESRKQTFAELNDLINRMPSGFLSRVDKFVGHGYGFIGDPLNAASTVAAPELIGTKVEPLLSTLADRTAMTDSFARVATKVSTGAIEGAGVMAPGALTHLAIADPYKDDFNALNAVTQIGVGGLLGGIGGGIGGLISLKTDPIQPISTDSARLAQQTAVGQLVSGNRVEVSPIIQEGFNNEKMMSPENVEENIENGKIQAEKELLNNEDDLTNKLNEVNDTVESILKKKNIENVERLPVEELNIPTAAARLNKIAEKPIVDRTQVESAFLDKLRTNPIINKYATILKIDPALREPAEQSFIDNIDKANIEPEVESMRSNINNDIERLKKRISDSTDASERHTLESAQLLKEKELDNLNKTPIDLKTEKDIPIEESLQELDKAQDKRLQSLKEIEDHNIALDVVRKPLDPVTGDQIKNLGEHVSTVQGEMALFPEDTSLRDEAEGIKDEPQLLEKDDIDTVKQMVRAGELTDNDLNIINAVDEELKNQDGYTKLIDSIGDCIKENI